ncbi:MAG: PAS domain S-box protein [Alphaproteobacteria bacterium]|nr:PAS domain S-box protein [Alphaproteobacteria bacterium]MBU1548199.1 PAS domain S-box protein [Alphaproteobacteria bacterium]MBU2336039.1 PAS domain S-box protein [Alphaproteobacteria bacterium]MBU2390566.1 PAS domain S-box protein [Alphaproteobacteria bacterium]MDY6962174.1 PAS domain S-box protein [Pseudomonadota bacterium]
MESLSEVALTEEERYRLLVDAITDYAIYMLDPDGRVSSWNPGAQRFKGYQAAEIIGEHFSRFYTDEDRATGLPARALRLAQTEGRFENEGWRVRKDGSRFWAHVIIDPIRSPSGGILGFAKVTRDLTERKAAELQLRDSEQQFQLLVQGVSDYAIYMLDPDGYITSWNSGARRIKGYESSEVVGSHFSRFYVEEDRAAGQPEKGLEIARREGRFEKEGIRQRKDGTRFWAHVIIDAIRDTSGNLIGFAKVTRDITEKVEAQQALNQAREDLFQAQKMEAIGQLTGGIAHDFNNLLMAVLGSLEILKKKLPDDPSMAPLLDNAIQGAERGVSLVQRMLTYSRKQNLNMSAVDVAQVVDGMMEFIQRAVGAEILLETRFPDRLPPVSTDPLQLETALLNLIVNARDAMPEGGRITVHADHMDESAEGGPGLGYVRLSVSDTGQGMDEETVQQATTPFFTTKGVGKGTGLGLSMVQGLAEQSGGRLMIESRAGEGTTISLVLPATEPEIPAETAGESVGQNKPDLQQGPLTVLAVDDDALVLMNTSLMLEDLGHTVIEAYNGKDALDVLRSGREVDLVITDHSMPRMTGAELAEEIRVAWPSLPIVLATGYAELPAGNGRKWPMLSKPFTQDQLETAIVLAARNSLEQNL